MSDTTNQITPNLAGCWIDGHHGHYANVQLICIAVLRGFTMSDEDAALVQSYNDESHREDFDFDGFMAIVDKADIHMEGLAPDGHYFCWEDGEYFLRKAEDEPMDYLGPPTSMGQDI